MVRTDSSMVQAVHCAYSMKRFDSRWREGVGKCFVDALVLQGRSGNGFGVHESPFGTTEGGLLDLRGLEVPSRTQLRRVVFSPADFSGSNWGRVWLERSSFEDSVFDSSRLLSASDHGNSFSKCRFLRASFRDAKVGYLGSRYRECVFDRTDFRGAGFIRPEYDSCTFSDCRLDGVDFNGASFEFCSFSGLLTNVWFRGGFWSSYCLQEFGQPRKNRMQGVSFERACLRGATFSDGCSLETVIPPSDNRHLLVTHWLSRLLRLEAEVQSWPQPSRAQGDLFVKVSITHARNQDQFILNRDDIVSIFGAEAAELIWSSLTKE